MANALYDLGRKAFGDAGVALLTDTIKAALIDTGAYTPNLATDQFFSIIPGAAVIGTPVTLANKTNVTGIFDADDAVFSGLVSAPTIEAVVIYKDTGVAGTSALIAYIDTGTGLPTPAGASQVTVVWANTTNKIFKL